MAKTMEMLHVKNKLKRLARNGWKQPGHVTSREPLNS